MTIVLCGDFEPEELLANIKQKLLPKENIGEIKR